MAVSKVKDLQDAAALISAKDHLAVGGTMEMAPVALVREIIRQGKRNLRLLCAPSGAISADMLIGAGMVKTVEFAQISLGEYGLAPHFRNAAESGTITILDHV